MYFVCFILGSYVNRVSYADHGFSQAIYVLSTWYTRREIAVRIAIMSTGVSLANGLSGLIAAAVFSTLDGSLGVAGWQWLFIVLACLGAFFVVIALFLLPDYPHSKTGSAMWIMSEDMRKIAQARIAADRVSETEIKTSIWRGLKLTVCDYKMWLLVSVNISISAAYGLSNLYPAIVRGFGYERTIALVMTFPPYVVAAIASILIAWNSDRVADRGGHFSTPIAVGMIGYNICVVTTATVPQYAASYLFIGGFFGANPLIQTWLTSTLAHTPEKKATAVALNNVLSQIVNVIAPFFFIASDEPRYWLAFILMFLMGGICIASAMVLKYCLWRQNRTGRRTSPISSSSMYLMVLAHCVSVETPRVVGGLPIYQSKKDGKQKSRLLLLLAPARTLVL